MCSDGDLSVDDSATEPEEDFDGIPGDNLIEQVNSQSNILNSNIPSNQNSEGP